MNEPQRSVQPQKEVPPSSDSSDSSDSSGEEKHPAQEPVGDNDGKQAGGAAAAPAPDLDNPEEHAKDD